MENTQKVLDLLATVDAPMRPGEIAQQTGIDKKELDKIIAKLKKDDKIHSPVRCTWAIKK